MFYTNLGGDQFALPNMRLTPKEKLDQRAAKPLAPTVEQKAPPGIFDTEARKQDEMF